MTVNAASGEEVAGKVIDIGVLSSSSSSSGTASAVSYPVTIALTQTTKGLRAGMSATAEIVTAQASGVVVPSGALQGSSVTVVRNGRKTTQRVETGVAGDSSTQVISGLNAGDQVVVTSASARPRAPSADRQQHRPATPSRTGTRSGVRRDGRRRGRRLRRRRLHGGGAPPTGGGFGGGR